MPEASPPAPIASTFDPVLNEGTITFDQPLDTGIPLVLGQWRRGVSPGFSRAATLAEYQSATVVRIECKTSALPTGEVVGWRYFGGAGGIEGVNGLAVAPFQGLTS